MRRPGEGERGAPTPHAQSDTFRQLKHAIRHIMLHTHSNTQDLFTHSHKFNSHDNLTKMERD